MVPPTLKGDTSEDQHAHRFLGILFTIRELIGGCNISGQFMLFSIYYKSFNFFFVKWFLYFWFCYSFLGIKIFCLLLAIY